MAMSDLEKLNIAVGMLTTQADIQSQIDGLRREINNSSEPLVWSVIDLSSVKEFLPLDIKSGWIFVLKKNLASNYHYHPNSTQYTVMLNGQGTSKIGLNYQPLRRFSTSSDSLEKTWQVIASGVPHAFLPDSEDMVVISFHTCDADNLDEVSFDTGNRRVYEPPQPSDQ
jgi:hypothetical protein